jgi:hypothetical protein
VAVFTALADPTRRALLNELARRGPATVSDLARCRSPARAWPSTSSSSSTRDWCAWASRPGAATRTGWILPRSAPPQGWLAALATEWADRLSDLRRYLDSTGDGSQTIR